MKKPLKYTGITKIVPVLGCWPSPKAELPSPWVVPKHVVRVPPSDGAALEIVEPKPQGKKKTKIKISLQAHWRDPWAEHWRGHWGW